MTNKRKIKILEGAKTMIMLRWRRFGLCGAIYKQLTNKEREKYDPYANLEFLNIKKPKQTYTTYYWFPLTKEGDAQRIELCNQAIKEFVFVLNP